MAGIAPGGGSSSNHESLSFHRAKVAVQCILQDILLDAGAEHILTIEPTTVTKTR